MDSNGYLIETVGTDAEASHVTRRFPWLAKELIREGKMKAKWCSSISTGTHELFYTVNLDLHAKNETTVCEQYAISQVKGTNVYLIVLINRKKKLRCFEDPILSKFCDKYELFDDLDDFTNSQLMNRYSVETDESGAEEGYGDFDENLLLTLLDENSDKETTEPENNDSNSRFAKAQQSLENVPKHLQLQSVEPIKTVPAAGISTPGRGMKLNIQLYRRQMELIKFLCVSYDELKESTNDPGSLEETKRKTFDVQCGSIPTKQPETSSSPHTTPDPCVAGPSGLACRSVSVVPGKSVKKKKLQQGKEEERKLLERASQMKFMYVLYVKYQSLLMRKKNGFVVTFVLSGITENGLASLMMKNGLDSQVVIHTIVHFVSNLSSI
ncbi:hypothetical protein ScPMuIL_007625 [Solemya velum]